MTPQWQAICLLLIWSLLTVLAAGMCCASCLLPFWIAGSVDLPASGGRIISSVSHLGLFRRCGYPTYESNGDVVWIQGCGYYPTMESVPHWVWRVTLALLIKAACLLVLLAFFVICAAVCTPLLLRSVKLSRTCSTIYLVAGEIVLHVASTSALLSHHSRPPLCGT
ncbi:LHFPL tetraspan subfamily member 6 protein [Taenia solium]|eukprot:TsM_000150000 transcript=TsM_000150000 gene=TsM_000150000